MPRKTRRQRAKAAAKAPQATEQHGLTPAVLQAQTDAMSLAQRLFDESKLCKCRSCNGLQLRAKATALIELVVKVMEATLQRSSGQYMAALRLRAACQASTPTCAGAGGFAMASVDVVYDRCVRTTPVLSSNFAGESALQRLA